MKKFLSFFTLAIALAAVAQASTFNYVAGFGSINITGSLTGTPLGSGAYNITAGTIKLIDSANPALDGSGIFVPIPANGNFYTGGGTIVTFSNWNSTLFPGLNPQLDSNGALTFDFTSGPATGTGVFFGSLGSDNYQIFGESWAVNALNGGAHFNATATPEPATMSMIGIALFAIGLARKRRNAPKL